MHSTSLAFAALHIRRRCLRHGPGRISIGTAARLKGWHRQSSLIRFLRDKSRGSSRGMPGAELWLRYSSPNGDLFGKVESWRLMKGKSRTMKPLSEREGWESSTIYWEDRWKGDTFLFLARSNPWKERYLRSFDIRREILG